MSGRRTPSIAVGAAGLIGVALIVALVLVLHGRGTSSTPSAAVSPAAAQASSTPIAVPTPTASPTVVAEPKNTAKPAVAQPHPTAAAVALDGGGAVPARAGVDVRLASLRKASVRSELPGETSGASYLVTITVTNHGSAPASLAGTVVNLFVGSTRTPAVETSSASKPVAARVAAHRSVRGTYVFRRPPGAATPLRVEVDLGATSTVVSFQGPASSAR